MLRWMGADAIGMSTVNEALAARIAGARVAAISCITNLGAGITGEKLDHEEVVEAGKQIAEDFCSLLETAIPHLAHELDSSGEGSGPTAEKRRGRGFQPPSPELDQAPSR